MENLHFLFAAYTAVWAMIFLYVWSMSRRTRRLEQQLEELLRLIEARERANASGTSRAREGNEVDT